MCLLARCGKNTQANVSVACIGAKMLMQYVMAAHWGGQIPPVINAVMVLWNL
jgi:hypothetical protein